MNQNTLSPTPGTPGSPDRHPFRGNRGSTQGVQIAFSGDTPRSAVSADKEAARGERGISIESIAAWHAEAERNRRKQHRRRGRHPRESERRHWLESDSPARRSGDTVGVGIVPELETKGE